MNLDFTLINGHKQRPHYVVQDCVYCKDIEEWWCVREQLWAQHWRIC